MNDHIRHGLDAAAGVTVIATIAGWLPPIAAAFSIVWLSLQIYGWFRRKEWQKP